MLQSKSTKSVDTDAVGCGICERASELVVAAADATAPPQPPADEHRCLLGGEQHIDRALHETRLAIDHRTGFHHVPTPQRHPDGGEDHPVAVHDRTRLRDEGEGEAEQLQTEAEADQETHTGRRRQEHDQADFDKGLCYDQTVSAAASSTDGVALID